MDATGSVMPAEAKKDETTVDVTSQDSTKSIAAAPDPAADAVLHSAYRKIDFRVVALALAGFTVGLALREHVWIRTLIKFV